jgi:cyclopropane fatty-acyl-phospholipid synthase-like methyltransferase
MAEKSDDHFQRIVKYYNRSKLGYDLVLHGSKHFGFYPEGMRISETQAQKNMLEKIGEALQLKKEEAVLDAGCGQGVVSTYLAKKYGCNIKGITIVPFEVGRSTQLARKMGVADKVEYSLMDYSATSFEDETFDCIYTIETLSHSPDIRMTLGELNRILKSGGRAGFFEYTVAKDGEFSAREMKMLDAVNCGSAMTGLRELKHEGFAELVKKAGFKEVTVQDITENTLPSLQHLYKLACIPYLFIRTFHMQEKYPNETAAVEFYKMAQKGLIRYRIFTAKKSA